MSQLGSKGIVHREEACGSSKVRGISWRTKCDYTRRNNVKGRIASDQHAFVKFVPRYHNARMAVQVCLTSDDQGRPMSRIPIASVDVIF